MIQNTGIRVCYTLDFHTITDLWANEEGLPLMILSDHFETAPFIIHTKSGTPIAPRTFEQTLELMCRAAGIRKVGVHALRHTYATRLFEKGVDIKVISELLGHSSTEITYKVYIHVIEAMKETAVEAIELD